MEERARSTRSGSGQGLVEPIEGRPIRTAAASYTPSAKKRREHGETRCPPRSWCRFCDEGRGISAPHARCDEEQIGVIGELHIDYCFLSGKAETEPATTIVGSDKHTQAVLAHVVPKNGTESVWVAQQLDRDVKKFGYNGRLFAKSDQEPAVVYLMNPLARRRISAPTVIEHSTAYGSKSNGRAENTVRRVEEQVRAMKLALEAAVGVTLDVHHPIFEWMVEHAANILTKCSVGRDGRTPYECIMGKRHNGQMLEFGSAVRVKYQGKLQGGIMRPRWGASIWLGKRWSTDENLVSMSNGKVVRARDVKSMPDDEAFDRALLLEVRGTPSNP